MKNIFSSDRSLEEIIKKIPIAGVRSLEDYYTKEEIDALLSVSAEIDLSSQCDGGTTEFDLGETVKGFVAANLNGTFVAATLNAAKTKITLAFSPDADEELIAIILR